MTDKVIKNKFENTSYEYALKTLQDLISDLESGSLSFDDTLKTYKEAFEYYTFLNDYLNSAGEKIKTMNENLFKGSSFSEV